MGQQYFVTAAFMIAGKLAVLGYKDDK